MNFLAALQKECVDVHLYLLFAENFLQTLVDGRCSTNDQIVVGENVSTPIAELFRLLRNNISFATHNNTGCQVIPGTSRRLYR